MTSMPRWLPFAVLAALFLALADFFVKQASSRISTSLGMLIYGLVTVSFGAGWVLYERLSGHVLHTSPAGLAYALGVGITFSAVTLLLYLTFARVEVSVGAPVIRLSGIVLASLMGIVILREPLTWRYLIGAALAVLGVALIIGR